VQRKGCANTHGAKIGMHSRHVLRISLLQVFIFFFSRGGVTACLIVVAKPGAIPLHNNGNSGETSGGSGGASNGVGIPGGSNGTSNETAVIRDEGSVSPPESSATR
jgi:hypothetical protein